MAENSTEQSSNTIIGILSATILIAVLLLSVVLVTNAISTANVDIIGNVTETIAVVNESGSANTTGYTLAYTSIPSTSTPVLTALFNTTSSLAVSLANATVSASGIVKNGTAVEWGALKISYTYVHDITNSSGMVGGVASINTNIISMVTNFFALMPTIGTVMAVIILIAGIVLLVLYVRRMKGTEEAGTFTG